MQPQDLENRFKRLMREAKEFWDRAQERKVKYGSPTKDPTNIFLNIFLKIVDFYLKHAYNSIINHQLTKGELK